MGTRRIGLLGFGVGIALLASSPAALAQRIPSHGLKHRVSSGTATNWSGYSVDGSGATSVTGTWTVQPSTCGLGENSWSSPWVGIDGDVSTTVEQTGTDSDCNAGQPYYYAWWEMYPKGTVVINEPIQPGDVMAGSVTYGSSGFVLSLMDTGNPGKGNQDRWASPFSTTQTSSKAARSSIEWIVEGPSTGLLTDFGSLTFSSDSASINNTSATLAGFGSSANSITMETKKAGVRAVPGKVQTNGSFTDVWKHG